ncbi:MAG TPA: hypothetical protein PKE45_06230 [Caldilineaceae bacterium]|nr:hypothetical protein [Caldilineaceae bacterium]
MYSVPAYNNTGLAYPKEQRTSRFSRDERRFCPSIFCFTDEIVTRRISPSAEVWLLTDETDDRSWMMMGAQPTCPHCGTTLLSVNGR